MVSTDDNEIAEVARDYGAAVPFIRSGRNSDDFATTTDVILEVLQAYQSQGRSFETACCIYATAPLITLERLNDGWKQLMKKKCDTVFPVVKFGYPIGRAMKMTDNKVTMIWPENLIKRSQDLPPAYHDSGQWYWFNCERLMKLKKLWTDNTYGVEIDELEVQDIDTLNDWKLAELKYALLQNT
jgi:pseudaminic acid cytidylyltransferase